MRRLKVKLFTGLCPTLRRLDVRTQTRPQFQARVHQRGALRRRGAGMCQRGEAGELKQVQ